MASGASVGITGLWDWRIFLLCMGAYVLSLLMSGGTFSIPSDPWTWLVALTFPVLDDAPMFLRWFVTMFFLAYATLTGLVIADLVRGALP